MSDFGDISRMDLSTLERKGQDPVKDEDLDEQDVRNEEPEGQERADKEPDSDGSCAGLSREAGEDVDDQSVREAGTAISAAAADEASSDPDVEVVEEEVRLPDPVGEYYYIDAKTTAKEMTAFLFAHNYRSPLMILATLVGLVWPIYTVVRAEGSVLVAVVCALVFLVFMPFSIWRRGTTSVSQNPIYQNVFHYLLDEKGLHLKIAENLVDVSWSQVTRTMFLNTSTVIYTGKINAYLIPTEAMGDQKDQINRFIKNQVAVHRMK